MHLCAELENNTSLIIKLCVLVTNGPHILLRYNMFIEGVIEGKEGVHGKLPPQMAQLHNLT